jgi:predicted O-methyltransferase YrrM
MTDTGDGPAELAGYRERLYRQGRAYDAGKADRPERLRNLEPESGQLIAVLIRVARARTVLEIGTSNGYSTRWLAEAAADLGGVLVT